MNRLDKNPREKRFCDYYKSQIIKPKDEKVIQQVDVVDENGSIKSVSREIVVNERELLTKIKPVQTSIDYIKMFGTLDNLSEVRYANSREITPEFINEQVKSIKELSKVNNNE